MSKEEIDWKTFKSQKKKLTGKHVKVKMEKEID